MSLTSNRSVTNRESRARERGLSIVEVMIAAALLLIIALGILPLFTRSIISNRKGLDSTEVSNLARSRLEEFVQLPLNDPQLTVVGGSTELVVAEHFSEKDEKWKAGTTPDAGDHAIFTRTTTVRQYSIDSTTTTGLSAALDGNASPLAVHLKEIEVTILGRAGGPLGPQQQLTTRVFKSQ